MAEAAVSPGRTRGMGELIEVAGKVTELAPFGRTLAELGAERPEIVGLTADMGRYSDILPFRDAHPTRFFNVGMAEQCLIMVAAGLAKTGKIAYCTTYSVFITRRAYDFVADRRSALKGEREDLRRHAGPAERLWRRPIRRPKISTCCAASRTSQSSIPCDATELKQVVRAVVDIPGTVYVRNLRGKVPVELPPDYKFEVGKAKLLRDGGDVGIISTGYMSARARDAAEAGAASGVQASVLHVSTIKPFDSQAVLAFARRFDRLIVAENHKTTGGLATLVVETLYDAGIVKPMIKIGLADSFFECGSQEYLESKYEVDLPRFVRAIVEAR